MPRASVWHSRWSLERLSHILTRASPRGLDPYAFLKTEKANVCCKTCHGTGDPMTGRFDADDLRRLHCRGEHPAQTRPFLAPALVYVGGAHSDAARLAYVMRQIVGEGVTCSMRSP